MVANLNDFWDWVQIDRKLVKQTVMTSVYGVTFIGARMQISNRLKERGPIASNPVDTYRAACYAAKVTLDALGEMLRKHVVSWLGLVIALRLLLLLVTL